MQPLAFPPPPSHCPSYFSLRYMEQVKQVYNKIPSEAKDEAGSSSSGTSLIFSSEEKVHNTNIQAKDSNSVDVTTICEYSSHSYTSDAKDEEPGSGCGTPLISPSEGLRNTSIDVGDITNIYEDSPQGSKPHLIYQYALHMSLNQYLFEASIDHLYTRGILSGVWNHSPQPRYQWYGSSC